MKRPTSPKGISFAEQEIQLKLKEKALSASVGEWARNKGDLYLNIFGSTFPDDKLYFQIFIFTLQLQFTAESDLSERLRSPLHRNTQANARDHDVNSGKT